MIKARTLSGFMELLPEEQIQMNLLLEEIKACYERFSFTPLDTPVMEAAEVLLAKGGGDTEKEIYLLEKGSTELALRFDLTVPLAKYVALYYDKLAFPFRRYQVGKVYRGERAQKGRFREFYQADIDIIGDGSLDISNDAEIPAVMYQVFQSLGLTNFAIHINNRKLLSGFYASLGLENKSGEIMRLVDKLDKVGAEKLRAMLQEELALTPAVIDQILDFMTLRGSNQEILTQLRGQAASHPRLQAGVDELEAVCQTLAGYGVPESAYVIDLSIARGLDYYTGTVYETLVTAHPEWGSICSGGRYDNLAGYYCKKQLPGVGMSIGVTRLYDLLRQNHLLNPKARTSPCDILILPMTDHVDPATHLAAELRAQGFKTQIYLEPKKFKHKMNYANKLQVPYLVFLGEDELNSGTISCKDMVSGDQQSFTKDAFIQNMHEQLARRDQEPLIAE